MKRTLFAGISACFIFLTCLGILFAYQALNATEQTDPTKDTGTVMATQLKEEPTPAQTEETTLPPETEPLMTAPTLPVLPEPSFSLSATHAFVYDCTTDRMLFVKGDPREQIAMASITKLFTGYVALQHLELDQVIPVGEEVTWIDPDSSVAELQPGNKLTVEMLMQGLMLPSGNDAAYTLAVAGGRQIQGDNQLSRQTALSLFVGQMNAEALAVGMNNTHFANPDGIDGPGHYTCIEDLVTLGRLTLENSDLFRYASQRQITVTYASGETNTWKNSNKLLHPDSEYYRENACGLKTGTTSKAGNCLLSAFRMEDGYLLVGVLGCERSNSRYEDTLRLYTYYTTGEVLDFGAEGPAPTQPAETQLPPAA